MKNRLSLIAILASIFLTACAGPGERMQIPVTMPGTNGGKATIVAHNQQVPDWWLDQGQLALNFMVKGDVDNDKLLAVAEAERACRIYTGTVRPSNLVAVLSGGALYALAGGIGVGFGSQAFPGAVQSQYQYYGAMASGTGGTANGVISLGGQTYTFENCGRELFDLFRGYEVRVLHKSPY